jgi:hypothetical protein
MNNTTENFSFQSLFNYSFGTKLRVFYFIFISLLFSYTSVQAGGYKKFESPVVQSSSKNAVVPPVELGGIIPKAYQMSAPWQLVNPFAPTSYGYGRGLVSWRQSEAKPKGFIAFSLRFW